MHSYEKGAVKWRGCRYCWLALECLLVALLVTGCAGESPSVLDPRGPAAARINALWWLMFGLGLLVYVVVMGYMLLGLFRRRSDTSEETEPPEGSNVVIWGGAIIPGIILLGVFGATVYTMGALQQPQSPDALTIEVTGHQWWWEVTYVDFGFTTANEIHIPVDQPIRFRLTSDDVIHSFWVPELQGKIDLIPGDVTTVWLEAQEEGQYLGECAEFCGIQHAKMQFLVIAQRPETFADWAAQQQMPAPEPVEAQAQEGQQVFLDSDCIFCHTIEGTNATGALGPDLTHLASRRTLAAGTVANTRGNLAGWIVDSQSIKPGNLMPPAQLSGAELQALLAYLETLE